MSLIAPPFVAGGSSFSYLSIGDSWSSGVFNFRKQTEAWDGNTNSCWRWKYAWPIMLPQDSSWTVDPIDFKSNACSGAHLSALTDNHDGSPGNPNPQMQDAGSPKLVTMQAGGNNVDFGKIVADCIFVGDVGLHPKEYPDPDAPCTKVINQQRDYLKSNSDKDGESFYIDHHRELTKVASHDSIKDKDVYLYVVGYGRYFNTLEGSEWCNSESFGFPGLESQSSALSFAMP